jgi:hypothetical protein
MERNEDDAAIPATHPGGARKVARRASPVLALVALAWVLKKLLTRSKD